MAVVDPRISSIGLLPVLLSLNVGDKDDQDSRISRDHLSAIVPSTKVHVIIVYLMPPRTICGVSQVW